MPKNLGLYDDALSTPRKQDVDSCYGPNNVPPYPVTSVNEKTGDVTLGASDVGAVNKAGDTMTGNLTVGSASMQTNGYVTGTWLKTTANTALSKTPTKIAVLEDGWVYSRTPEQIKSDIGLSNVDNVKQYSSNNPPPYPVTSVNGQTGDVTVSIELPENLVKYDVMGEVESTQTIDATTLQGYNANYFATAAETSNLQTDVGKLQTNVSNLQTEQENINTSLLHKQEIITKQSVTFSTDWIGDVSPYSQIVTISGTTTNSKVDLQPNVTVIQQMIDDGTVALQIVNDDGTLIAYAVGEKPTVPLTVQATITEVSA